MKKDAPIVFGKRNVQRAAAARPELAVVAAAAPDQTVALDAMAPDYATFFAAVRAEMAQDDNPGERHVPWSFKAAWLTGLVVGCALAGFDVTGQTGADHFTKVAGALGVQADTSTLLPAMIALGLFAGARVSAMTTFCAHAVLAHLGSRSYAAYAVGGATASAAFAGLVLAATGHPPAHGWVVELMAGTGAGLCYRAIAGSSGTNRRR